jgi:hypothetical protein
MKDKAQNATLWVHYATYSYRLDEPDYQMESLWIVHPGWGYIRGRDLWVPIKASPQKMEQAGFVELTSDSDGEATRCPHCQMLINGIPGGLVSKHLAVCGGSEEKWQKLEELLITDQRIKWLEAQILGRLLREKAEREEAERKERFGKIREDMLARQHAKDRKKRMKEQTRQEWKKR